jgi:type I restriction enzyme S subunit
MTHTWPKVRLKFAVDKIGSGKTPLGGATTYISSGIMLLRSQNIHFDGLRLEDVVFIDVDTDAQMASTRVQPDDVLLNITGASLGRCTIAPKDISPANVNQHVCILRPNKKHVEPRFLNMTIQSAPIQRAIFVGENGSSREGLTFEQIGNFEIALPPLPDQQAIADYLDQETVRLDGLVAAKERVLGLLAEKRRALITRAVTRGLSPRVPFRNSGIPWLGEIPAHWELIPLRFLIDIVGGATLDTGKAEFWDGDIPWVSPKDMKRDEIKDAEDHVSALALSSSALRLIDPVSVLIVVRGMILAHSFPTAVTTQPVTINQDMKALRCRELLEPHYLRDLFRGLEARLVSIAEESAHGTRKLESEVLGRFQVCVPPIDEQNEIVGHITAETAKLDALHSATERTIALLKERRAALIAAAVTGKLDVQGAGRHIAVVAD